MLHSKFNTHFWRRVTASRKKKKNYVFDCVLCSPRFRSGGITISCNTLGCGYPFNPTALIGWHVINCVDCAQFSLLKFKLFFFSLSPSILPRLTIALWPSGPHLLYSLFYIFIFVSIFICFLDMTKTPLAWVWKVGFWDMAKCCDWMKSGLLVIVVCTGLLALAIKKSWYQIIYRFSLVYSTNNNPFLSFFRWINNIAS